MFVVANNVVQFTLFPNRPDHATLFTTSPFDRDKWLLKQKIGKYCRLTPEQLIRCETHVQLWKHCIRLNQPILVVESRTHFQPCDVYMACDMLLVGFAMKHTPPQYVTNHIDQSNLVVPSKLIDVFAYVITPRGAKYLVQNATPYNQPLETYIEYVMNNNKSFHCLGVYPSLLSTI